MAVSWSFLPTSSTVSEADLGPPNNWIRIRSGVGWEGPQSRHRGQKAIHFHRLTVYTALLPGGEDLPIICEPLGLESLFLFYR